MDSDSELGLSGQIGQTSAKTENKPQKTPWQQFAEDSEKDDKTKMVGGEIISPTAVRVPQKGETYEQVKKEAEQGGWIAAITSAYGKEELPDADRQKNVQDLVNAAKAAGVPKEALRTHLESIGVPVTDSKADEIPTASVSKTQEGNNQGSEKSKSNETDEYTKLENVKKAKEQLLNNLKMPDANWSKIDRDTIKNILYTMLTTRSNYGQLLQRYGGLQGLRNSTEYQQYKAMTGKIYELGKQYKGELNVDYNPAWLGVNARADVSRREGINIKSYVTLPPEGIDFVQHVPELALALRQLAVDSDDIIQVKIPTSYETLVKNNDNIIVHYKKAENAQKVGELLGQWMQQNQITEAPREMGRTKVAVDPKGTSFSDAVTEHIAKWMQENYGKYGNDVLADEAIKYAIKFSQNPPQVNQS